MPLSRRTFIKQTAAATAATTLGGTVPSVLGKPKGILEASTPNKWRGRVVINFNKNVVTDYGKKQVDDDIVRRRLLAQNLA